VNFDVGGEYVANGLQDSLQLWMDMNQRILQMVMKQDYFFCAFPSKTLQKVKDVMVEKFYDWEMKKPLVIGKATKPQRFENNDIKKLTVHWKSNKKASMTCITEEWPKAFNAKMEKL
jgi:hypothetical protein